MSTDPRLARQNKPENGEPAKSKVVQARFANAVITDADLVNLLGIYGPVAYVTLSRTSGGGYLASVEFENLESAEKCVDAGQKGGSARFMGLPVFFNFSTSQQLYRGPMETAKPNNIITITVSNSIHPINARVIHKACSPYGQVRRVAIVRREAIHALVEFDSTEAATKAKFEMNGADLYAGCCTLKVEYGRPDVVKVYKRSIDQWDYTIDPSGPPPTLLSTKPSCLPKGTIDAGINEEALAHANVQPRPMMTPLPQQQASFFFQGPNPPTNVPFGSSPFSASSTI